MVALSTQVSRAICKSILAGGLTQRPRRGRSVPAMSGGSMKRHTLTLGGMPATEMLESRMLLSSVAYTVTLLNLPGGYSSAATGINASGQVVGYSSYDDANYATHEHAFLYSGSTMANLGTLGGRDSFATAINDSGQVVGWSDTPGNAASHAFLYSGSTMTDLGTFGGTTSIAHGINASGQVVGEAFTTAYPNSGSGAHAFLYSGSTMTDLGTLGGYYSGAKGINASGQVVGTASTDIGYQRAFLYSGSTMTDLGTLGGVESGANGINNSGQVVGTGTGLVAHAFLYSGSTMTDLGALGGTQSVGNAINNKGQVVGQATTAGNTSARAFLYSGSTMYDLSNFIDPLSGWRFESATGINDRGQIVGDGRFGGYYGEDFHAFLLTPIDMAPTNVALSGSAVPEGKPAGTTVGILSATDPNPGSTFTYSLVAGSGWADNAKFSITGNTLKANSSFDYETKSSYTIRVRVTDDAGLSYEKAFAINVTNVAETAMVLDGTVGNDTLAVSLSGTKVRLTRNGAIISERELALVSQLNINGLSGNDTITIAANLLVPAYIFGGDGNDTITGGSGNDTIYGNFGDDFIIGGAGNDSILGGLGADLLSGQSGNDRIFGGDESDTIYGGAGNDYIEGKGKADTLYGGGGNDTILGGAGSDLIYGEAGDDWIYVGDIVPLVFHDTVYAGAGTDRVSWDAGDTILEKEIDLLA